MKANGFVKGTLDVVLIGAMALGLVTLTGCGSSGNGGSSGGGGTAPNGALATGGAASLYAIEGTESGTGASILTFGIATANDPSPTQTLVTPSTFAASAVATDSTGQLYVGGQSTTDGSEEILVYAAGATGTATPTRTISTDPTLGLVAISMAVDATGQIYVAGYYDEDEFGSVSVFPAGANGLTTASTLLTSTTLTTPIGIAVDTAGKIYVSNVGESGGQILVFAAGATGTDAPVETISTAAATSTTASVFSGLAVDGSSNIFAVQDAFTLDSSGDATSATVSVEEFAPGSTGVASPAKTISVGTGLILGGGLQLDGVGNVYLITQTEGSNADTYNLLGFGPNASGTVTPGFTITPSALNDASTQIAVH